MIFSPRMMSNPVDIYITKSLRHKHFHCSRQILHKPWLNRPAKDQRILRRTPIIPPSPANFLEPSRLVQLPSRCVRFPNFKVQPFNTLVPRLVDDGFDESAPDPMAPAFFRHRQV
ncbi:MAG: hypothetical protein ACREN3_13830, partial [Gemmatimonadaceae bacterium]